MTCPHVKRRTRHVQTYQSSLIDRNERLRFCTVRRASCVQSWISDNPPTCFSDSEKCRLTYVGTCFSGGDVKIHCSPFTVQYPLYQVLSTKYQLPITISLFTTHNSQFTTYKSQYTSTIHSALFVNYSLFAITSHLFTINTIHTSHTIHRFTILQIH